MAGKEFSTMYLLQDLDTESQGPLTAALDAIAANGVPQSEARAFVAWLDQTITELQRARDTAIQDLRDYVDEHPEQLPIVPTAESMYHPTKEAAQAVGVQFANDPRVAATQYQLEPYNGWVVVLTPAPADLSQFAGIAEIAGRSRVRPTGKKGPTTPQTRPDNGGSAPAAGGGGGGAPVKGATALVWAIADTYKNEKGTVDRGAIIGLCTAANINPATAATQYSKWKKARGL